MKLLLLLLLTIIITCVSSSTTTTTSGTGTIFLTDNLDMDVESFTAMFHANSLDLLVVSGKGVKAAEVATSILDLDKTKNLPPIYTVKQPDILNNNILVSILQGFANNVYFTFGLKPPSSKPLPESQLNAKYIDFLSKYNKINIVSVPEFTHLANFLQVFDQYGSKQHDISIYAMGGSVVGGLHRGNVNIFDSKNTEAEYNVWADPQALQTSLELCTKHKIPLYLYPLETTDNFPVTQKFLQDLASIKSYPLIEYLGRYETNAYNLYKFLNVNLYHWDIIPALSALNYIDINFIPVNISVSTQGVNAGATYIDVENGHEVQLADPYSIASLPLEDIIVQLFSS